MRVARGSLSGHGVAPEGIVENPSGRNARAIRTRVARYVVATALVGGIALLPRAARAGTLADATLPRRDLLEVALAAYHRIQDAGILHTPVLTVIDYSLPSSERRLWVLDPDRIHVLFHEFVAHGRGSTAENDPDRAVRFGNDPESHRSSLGTFLTGETYTGKHGHSLALIGLDAGVNDRAVERRVVMHPADYVSASFRARRNGRIGRSWGCPALDPAVAPAIIDRIRDGSVVYVAGATPPPTVSSVATSARGGMRRGRVSGSGTVVASQRR